MSIAYLAENNRLVLGILALVIIVIAVIYYYNINIGGAIFPQQGNAYLTLNLKVQDYFGDNSSLPSKLHVAVFDENHDTVINSDLDISTLSNINVELTVPVNRPRFYIRVSVPSTENGLWYIEYPSQVNTLAPTLIANETVYPVNLRSMLGELKPNQEYSATLTIVLLKTNQTLKLDMPSVINMTGTVPVTTTISGTLLAPEKTGYKNVVIYVKTQDNQTVINGLVFAGTSYNVTKINDTTYKAVIGNIIYGINETSKTISVMATINNGTITTTNTTTIISSQITVEVFDKLPNGTETKLATDTTTVNIIS